MKYTIFASGSFLFQSVLFGMVLTFSGINTWVQGAERLGHSPKTEFVQSVAEICHSVVSIQGEKKYEAVDTPNTGYSQKTPQKYDTYNGMGTGVIIDERGYILTNYHVIKGLMKLEVITSDGTRYRDVELIRHDLSTDLAIIKIKPSSPLKKIKMGRSRDLFLAEDVYAIGNPFGYHSSITRGIVSALHRPLEVSDTLSYDDVIQTDAAINPGNSGGPLINVDGEMIGLNAAVREGAESIAFAIPVDFVADVADKMIKQSVAKMTHHGLTLEIVDADSELYPDFMNGEDCLLITKVEPKSPADIAGIRPGDVLQSSNNFPVHTPLDFTCSLIGLSLMDTASLTVERGGSEIETSIAFSGLSAPTLKNNDRDTQAIAMKVNKPVMTDNDVKKSGEKSAAGEIGAVSQAPVYRNETGGAALVNADLNEKIGSNKDSWENLEDPIVNELWKKLGIRVEVIDEKTYKTLCPDLSACTIHNFAFVISGGVRVTRVDPDSILCQGDAKIQIGDIIFGLGLNDTQTGQVGIKTLENLYYLASWKEHADSHNNQVKLYLIRKNAQGNNTPCSFDLDLNLLP